MVEFTEATEGRYNVVHRIFHQHELVDSDDICEGKDSIEAFYSACNHLVRAGNNLPLHLQEEVVFQIGPREVGKEDAMLPFTKLLISLAQEIGGILPISIVGKDSIVFTIGQCFQIVSNKDNILGLYPHVAEVIDEEVENLRVPVLEIYSGIGVNRKEHLELPIVYPVWFVFVHVG